eukprot:Ihof_evm1s1302 gene=Ihof_evmTU1s1302
MPKSKNVSKTKTLKQPIALTPRNIGRSIRAEKRSKVIIPSSDSATEGQSLSTAKPTKRFVPLPPISLKAPSLSGDSSLSDDSFSSDSDIDISEIDEDDYNT